MFFNLVLSSPFKYLLLEHSREFKGSKDLDLYKENLWFLVFQPNKGGQKTGKRSLSLWTKWFLQLRCGASAFMVSCFYILQVAH